MPTKIETDQPQARRRTIQFLVATATVKAVEPPYFSVPMGDPDNAVADPADANRELRPGEIFFATPLIFANNAETAQRVTATITGEGGVSTFLATSLIIPPKDVLYLPPGLSLFKRDLANPTDDGDALYVSADANGAVTLTFSVVEREALEHAPDTEV